MGINSQVEVNLIPSIENGNLKLTLTNAKVGKININNKVLSKVLEKNMNKVPFTIKDNIIIIEKQQISPMTLKKIIIEDDRIIVDLQIKINNLINFINTYDFKINDL